MSTQQDALRLAREARNKMCIDGHLNDALDAIMASNSPDGIFCILGSVADKAIEIALASHPADHAGEATNMTAQPAEAPAGQGDWRKLFDRVALALNCLPSSFHDGNEHVIKAAERAAQPVPAVPEGWTIERVDYEENEDADQHAHTVFYLRGPNGEQAPFYDLPDTAYSVVHRFLRDLHKSAAPQPKQESEG